MASAQSLDVAHRARELYEDKLRPALEAAHPNAFVAIEPESGEYFLGDSLSAAVQTARKTYPERLAFVLRVGHPTAIHMGVLAS